MRGIQDCSSVLFLSIYLMFLYMLMCTELAYYGDIVLPLW